MELRDGKYGWPVLRYGRVVSVIDIDPRAANAVADMLVCDADRIETRLKENPSAFGYERVTFVDRNCHKEYREGAIVHYPRYLASFDGVDIEATASVTVCPSPRQGKIWQRTSYQCNGKNQSCSPRMTEEAVLKFFEKAIPVSAKSAGKWLAEYNDALDRQSVGKVKGVHTITIQTVAADLGLAGEELKSRAFKMISVFKDPKRYGSLPGFLHMVYGEDIDNYDRYNQLSEQKKCEWVAMSVLGEAPMVGLYSRQRTNGRTNLIGVVHEVNDEPAVLSERARALSGRLVQEIGPMI